ncbi:MAG: pyridoxal-phosphate dependent enzyme [Planctomycetes bacterium]|nr:pyridoxal-phosphate dependent enzyme [Planctomycetota bacterium]MBI3844943.1 pyridoxal-phosphate dependent enzyme [Planctomycetota bacterium]
MPGIGLETHVVDRAAYDQSVRRFRELKIVLPTFAQLMDPSRIPARAIDALAAVDPDAPHAANLFRVHWHNAAGAKRPVAVPEHLVLPRALTGVDAPIVAALGNRFPMIRAHKVLAAYGCLAPRIVTGQFDPTRHKAVWPSTGNYCRGGVAISRILGCRGVAVLPAGMSRERFEWLERWVAQPADIVRTPGTESNVKEIYDECARLSRDPGNVIFNQFAEFGNHLVHRLVTGAAMERVFEHVRRSRPALRLAAFVSATGSAGTIGAGDALRERHGAKVVAVEALECPTLLENGFGEHNIQGIGDKHVPFIHNVMGTDVVVAVSDHATDALDALANGEAGRRYLVARRGVPEKIVTQLDALGLSSWCNVVAAIKVAKTFGLGADDAILTVATDGAAMYGSSREAYLARRHPRGFDEVAAGEAFERHLAGASTDHVLDLTWRDRNRIFNLGYFTWVEQQGVSLADFEARRRPEFWKSLEAMVPAWDAMIDEMNGRTGVATPS